MTSEAAQEVLVGRKAEVDLLATLVAAVRSGRGGSAWVEGEPGIGKSALLATALASTGGLADVYAGSAHDGDRLFPLRVLLDALRIAPEATDVGRAEIVALLRGTGTSALMPTDVMAAAAELVLVLVQRLCATSPVVLVVDDIQWADELSLSLWRRLHDLTLQAPLLLVAACRPVPQRAEVDALHDEVSRGGGTTIGLGPLTSEQVNELVRRLIGADPRPGVRRQADMAAGNPMYVTEMVEAWTRAGRIHIHDGVADLADPDAPAPVSLTAAISARLNFLSEATRPVVRVAAMLGATFAVEHLGVVTGRTTVELLAVIDEATAAHVIISAGPRLAFRHPLIRQALYEQLPASVRSALHRQIAQALAGSGEPVETVAEHVVAATNAADNWTRNWTVDHALVLIRRAPELAASLLQRALDQTPLEDPLWVRIGVHLVAALDLLGRYDDSQRLAQTVLTRSPDPEVRARMGWAAGHGLRLIARYDEALAVVGQVLHDQPLTPSWRARLRALQAVILDACGKSVEAETVAAQAEAESIAASDRAALAHSLQTLARVRFVRRADGLAFLKDIDRASDALGESTEFPDVRMWLLTVRAPALDALGRPDEAERAIAAAMIEAEGRGLAAQLTRVRLQAADLYYFLGRWDDVLVELENLTEPNQVIPAVGVWAHGLGALIAHHRDGRAEYDVHQRAVADVNLTDGDLRYYAENHRIADALSAERHGQLSLALTSLLGVFNTGDTGKLSAVGPDSGVWLPDLVRLALADDDAETAAAATNLCVDLATASGQPRIGAAAQHCRGLLDADPAAVEAAAVTFGTIRYRLWQGQANEDAAVLHARRGDHTAARAAYQQAIDVYTALDAAWTIRRADTRLRDLGIRRGQRGLRPRRPSTGWRALTPSETTVAELVAAGLSNPDIAERLFVSRRTVGTHVTHILAKLGAHSRVDIAREATQQGLHGSVMNSVGP